MPPACRPMRPQPADACAPARLPVPVRGRRHHGGARRARRHRAAGARDAGVAAGARRRLAAWGVRTALGVHAVAAASAGLELGACPTSTSLLTCTGWQHHAACSAPVQERSRQRCHRRRCLTPPTCNLVVHPKLPTELLTLCKSQAALAAACWLKCGQGRRTGAPAVPAKLGIKLFCTTRRMRRCTRPQPQAPRLSLGRSALRQVYHPACTK
jgi:hypothetical protein